MRIDFVPSGAAWDALEADPAVEEAVPHLEAALLDAYGLKVLPMISDIPGAPEGGGPAPPPVTPDGTGTLCQSDEDCPGDGVHTCLTGDALGGFCTKEGCGTGECETPYLCCHDCNPAVADALPFEESACLPEALKGQLTTMAGCTCD